MAEVSINTRNSRSMSVTSEWLKRAAAGGDRPIP